MTIANCSPKRCPLSALLLKEARTRAIRVTALQGLQLCNYHAISLALHGFATGGAHNFSNFVI